MAVELVVAYSENRVIGRDGDLPWRLPTDLARFKEITMGGAVVMGRRTWESIPPKFRPLPGRRNIVLTRSPDFAAEGAEVLPSLDAALAATDGACFVIGGGTVYAEALPLADVVHATVVEGSVEGDTLFPVLPESFVLADESEPVEENGFRFTFRRYVRDVTPDGTLYDLSASREPAQRARMARLEREGICMFCPEHVEREQPTPVEWRGEHWYVTRNAFPYPGTVAHYLIVPNTHVTSFDQLPDEAGAELWAIRRRLKTELAPLATATVERSGDMRYSGGSIAHLHVHFVALPAEPSQTVKFRVSARAPGD
ncbi:MAG TPA: dihydrofolate reductase [Solirubrobacteraceae bacterium]|nr:dihydrofolate reductase [Solirubrobacteraceae bacterium]